MYVFVYGTLKKDEPNHYWLTTDTNGLAKFVGAGTLINQYPLVITSKYNIPFLLDHQGVGKKIHGEVYEIDEKMIENLDILEGYPKLFIRREEPVKVKRNHDGAEETIHAWVYLLSQFRQETMELPHLESYNSTGPHNLPYITSEDDLNDANDLY